MVVVNVISIAKPTEETSLNMYTTSTVHNGFANSTADSHILQSSLTTLVVLITEKAAKLHIVTVTQADLP